MGAPDEIKRLVERFSEEDKSKLNETQVRQSFIDPLFDSLGWDVASKSMRRQAQREVVLEDSIKVDDATKAPDYGFYLGGVRRFFAEAKAPWVPIDTHVASAFQLRRYGWSANLPVSILTDFEELAIYNCRVEPSEKDAATTARIEYLRFDEFEERWEEVEGIFTKRAINFSDPEDVAKHDLMVTLVERMLELHQQISEVKSPPERSRIQGRISSTDRRIDELVYELYGLSDDEIELVEGTG